MLLYAVGADKTVSHDQRRGCEGVEDCVEAREKRELLASYIESRVEVDKPEKKDGGGGADDEDRGDGWARAGAGSGGWARRGHARYPFARAQSMSAVKSSGR